MAETAVIWDSRYLLHEPGAWHPERPERLLAIKKVLEKPIGKKLIRLEPRLATPEEISLIHDFEYVKKIEATAGHEMQLDPDTSVSPKSWEAASLAVGGMLTAVDWVIGSPGRAGDSGRASVGSGDGFADFSPEPPSCGIGRAKPDPIPFDGVSGERRISPDSSEHLALPVRANNRAEPETGPAPIFRNAFAFVRPPGHHAERARAMGFCLFNNVAVAAEYALRKPGIQKVLIIDYDVHHGNGTQSAFYDRRDVFYISTHRYPFYPGTGARREEGEGQGKGFTLNVPFSGGQGDEEYLKAFDQEIIPTTRDFCPDLILVSAGYDAHRLDPLGGMNITAQGFAEMTQKILEVAKASSGGRMVMVLEGGYSLEGLAESVEACLYSLFKS